MSGRRSTTPCSRSQRVVYHVSQISRPLTALTVRFLKMRDSAMSIVAGREGIPKRTTLPPCRTIPKASSIARSAPDISKTTPTPFPSFCSANHAGTSSASSTFTTASAPSVRASSIRKDTWSEAKSRPAPNAFAIAIVKRPTGAGRLFRSEEHTSELQSRLHLVCRLLLEKKKKQNIEAVCRLRQGGGEQARASTIV